MREQPTLRCAVVGWGGVLWGGVGCCLVRCMPADNHRAHPHKCCYCSHHQDHPPSPPAGYSKHDLSSTANTRLGTPVYMAPEVIFINSKYDAKKADVWSCGESHGQASCVCCVLWLRGWLHVVGGGSRMPATPAPPTFTTLHGSSLPHCPFTQPSVSCTAPPVPPSYHPPVPPLYRPPAPQASSCTPWSTATTPSTPPTPSCPRR